MRYEPLDLEKNTVIWFYTGNFRVQVDQSSTHFMSVYSNKNIPQGFFCMVKAYRII